jgi:hypothetical protein
MTTVTWYAFQDPKTKREYYYEPMTNKSTWTLPTASTPVRAPAAIPASPVSPASIISTPTKVEKYEVKAEGSSSKLSVGKRGIAVTIGSILFLNTLCLGILVKVMYISSKVDVEPIYDAKIVPSADNARLEPDNYDSVQVAEETALHDMNLHDSHTENVAAASAEEDARVIESNPPEIEEDCVIVGEEEVSVEEDYAEKEAKVSDVSSSSDATIAKGLTRHKIISIITPVIHIVFGYGAARIAVALIARAALILSPPVAPVVVVQAAGPVAIIKTFFERFLGRSSPAAIVVKDPTVLETIVNMFAKLLKIK